MPSIPNARRHSSSSGERVSITSNRAIRPTLRIRGGKLLMMDLRRLNVPSSACIEGGSSSQVHRVVVALGEDVPQEAEQVLFKV